jgi:hypothetical protein
MGALIKDPHSHPSSGLFLPWGTHPTLTKTFLVVFAWPGAESILAGEHRNDFENHLMIMEHLGNLFT